MVKKINGKANGKANGKTEFSKRLTAIQTEKLIFLKEIKVY